MLLTNTTYRLEYGNPYIRKRTEEGWTADFIFNRDNIAWSGGSIFYYWGISGETIESNYADNNLSFGFTDDGKIIWKSIRYTPVDTLSGTTSVYTLTSGATPTLCDDGTSRDFNITITFKRNTTLFDCDLENKGGLNDLISSVTNTTALTDWLTGGTETKQTVEILSKKWYNERNYRLGTLKIYLNGNQIYKLDNFEEIIPSQRESENYLIQSWGAGSEGMDDIHLGVCQFLLQNVEYYETPLNFLEIKNRYKKDIVTNWDIIECSYPCGEGPTPTPSVTPTITPTTSLQPTHTPTQSVTPTVTPSTSIGATPTITPTVTPTNTITPTTTPTMTPDPTRTPTGTPEPSPSIGATHTPTPTPSHTPASTPGGTPGVTPTNTPTITPSITPASSPTFNTGPFSFDFDYMVVEYFFSDGTDMDTLTYLTNPAIMNNDFTNGLPGDYVGTCAISDNGPQFPNDGINNPYLVYGGDNTGVGTEAVLFDLVEFKNQRPSDHNIEITFTSTWYGTPGSNPVVLRATLWKGGSPVQNGFTFENPSASATQFVESDGTIITSNTKNCEAFEEVSKFVFNTQTYEGYFVNPGQTGVTPTPTGTPVSTSTPTPSVTPAVTSSPTGTPVPTQTPTNTLTPTSSGVLTYKISIVNNTTNRTVTAIKYNLNGATAPLNLGSYPIIGGQQAGIITHPSISGSIPDVLYYIFGGSGYYDLIVTQNGTVIRNFGNSNEDYLLLGGTSINSTDEIVLTITDYIAPTPTPTETPTQTPTPTETPAVTPTNTPTETIQPTQTPTNTVTPTASPCATGATFVTTTDTMWIYPQADIDYVLAHTSVPVTFVASKFYFNNRADMKTFYDEIFVRTEVTQPVGNTGYSLGVGTLLLDLTDELYFVLIDTNEIVVTWRLTRQLTDQTTLPAGGNSPIETVGYLTVAESWPVNDRPEFYDPAYWTNGDNICIPPISINGALLIENGNVLNSENGNGLLIDNTSPTPTPTSTVTSTVTVTPTLTPTNTQTITPSLTPSLTPSQTPNGGVVSKSWDITQCESTCNGIGYCDIINPSSITVYTIQSATNLTDPSTVVYSDSSLTTRWNGYYYYFDIDTIFHFVNGVAGLACQVGVEPCIPTGTTPTPTPTKTTSGVTPTPTPSVSPDVTPTNTPTPSMDVTSTPTITPSNSPDVTPTPTQSLTPSLTPSITPTNSVTPTPEPTPSPTASPIPPYQWFFYKTEGSMNPGDLPTSQGNLLLSKNNYTTSTFDPNHSLGDYLEVSMSVYDSAGNNYTSFFENYVTTGGLISLTQNGTKIVYQLPANQASVWYQSGSAQYFYFTFDSSTISQIDGSQSKFDYTSPIYIDFNPTPATHVDGLDFTIEFWLNLETGQPTFHPRPYSISDVVSSNERNGVSIENGNTHVYWWANGDPSVDGPYNIPYNTWVHYAIVRDNGNSSVYINGSLFGTSQVTANISTNGVPLAIGGQLVNNIFDSGVKGKIADFRWTQGLVYRGASFPVPTAPLTDFTGVTKLLLNAQYESEFNDSSYYNKTITNNGNVVFDPSSPYPIYDNGYNYGSLKFDGTNYLSIDTTNGDFDL